MKKSFKTLVIQPNPSAKCLPYPFFVGEDGKVGRQDFWKGKPYRFIGLAPADEQKIIFDVSDLFKMSTVPEGLYPVFADRNLQFYTDQRFCEFKITEKEAGK